MFSLVEMWDQENSLVLPYILVHIFYTLREWFSCLVLGSLIQFSGAKDINSQLQTIFICVRSFEVDCHVVSVKGDLVVEKRTALLPGLGCIWHDLLSLRCVSSFRNIFLQVEQGCFLLFLLGQFSDLVDVDSPYHLYAYSGAGDCLAS